MNAIRQARDRWRRLPVVLQMTPTECGAACLASVLTHHGGSTSLEQVRLALDANRDGASVLAVVRTARRFGLRASGVKLDVGALSQLPRGSLLLWRGNHLVVLERVRRDAVELMDPSVGRRTISVDACRRQFGGLAIPLLPGPGFERARKPRRPVWRYLWRALRDTKLLPGLLVTSAILQVLALALPLLTGTLVDRVVPSNDAGLLKLLGLSLLAFLGAHLGVSLVRGLALVKLRARLDLGMTRNFLRHLLALPYTFFQRRSAGDLLLRLNSNAAVREIVASSALTAIIDGMLAVGYLVLLFAMHVRFALLVAVVASLELVIFLATRRRHRELLAETLHAQAESQAYQVDLLEGIQTVKLAGAEKGLEDEWSRLFGRVVLSASAGGRLEAVVEVVSDSLQIGSRLLFLWYAATLVLGGEMSLGTSLALVSVAGGFLRPVSSLVALAGRLQLLGTYLDRMDDVLRAEPERVEAGDSAEAVVSGHLEVSGLTFGYGGGPAVLQDISFRVQPGATLAIVGTSGAGKSTLAHLLVGLYDPRSGGVYLDGRRLGSSNLQPLRRSVGFVPQQPRLFAGTVRQNIALGAPEYSLEDVAWAAELAQLKNDIAAMPMGYDTLLSGGASEISGGQRQRIAVARALVRRPALLVMDEATSALDAETEAALQASLAKLQCTKVVVAHRLSTVKKANLVLVLEAGRIVEQGTHDALVSKHGAYSRLVRHQYPISCGEPMVDRRVG